MTGEAQIHPGDTDEFAFHAADRPLPESADVVVIGGGIVGASTAYFLAQAGVSVALFEKGRIAGEQSGRNWGWVRQQCRSPVELPLMMESLAIWKELPARLGEDVGFHQGGTLYLGGNEAELAGLAEWLAVAREPLLGVYGGDPFGRAEAVDARAALRSSTIWAAHQTFMDDITGSLEPGKRADIAVWDTDFYAAPVAALKDAACDMTIFDGDVVHRSDRFP